MIVELIGCDGAGKTTLAQMVAGPGGFGARAVVMADLVLDRPGLRGIAHPTARNVAQEVGSLPYFLHGFRRRRAYLSFARRMLARHAPSTFHRLNGMRGIVRRVGMYELAHSRAVDRVVLSDEGTVLSAYMFALTNAELDRANVARFAELVPAPDKLVYVKAPIEALVDRALARLDRRPQHAGRSAEEIEETIRRTVGVFDLVADSPPLRDRVFVVENDGGRDSLDRLCAGIAAELRPSASAAGVALGRLAVGGP